jgi:glutamate formiminotransferase
MRKIVQCVPNFSEGRRRDVVDGIVAEITGVRETLVLDVEMDADHNRSVVTFIGTPLAVEEAALKAAGKAAELIDLRHHKGEHPRMGATDVVPFVPISGVTMAECVEIARRVGEKIAERYGIPVYLYESAATRPDREDLAQVRSLKA